jgi:hypothetical protein
LFSINFLVLFLILIIAAAYYIRKATHTSDEPFDVEEVVGELLPLIDDRRLFRRHLKSYLARKRVFGQGTVSRFPRVEPHAVVFMLEERVAASVNGGIRETDIGIELSFYEPDAPTEVNAGDFVEFTGILLDVAVRMRSLVLSVEASEIQFIGDERGKEASEEPDVPEPDLTDNGT